ncbi:MAG: HlyD family efflux transporter periplasmic adaptor subunit [Bacteroidales bacterium]|jgi:HlyD family secretion protein|nr:HlyD family efflux transporter periplasmic adaptor subunit [Bacteroidales bacterium]
MRSKIYLLISLLFLAACNGNENGADAYGNFEAREIIVSSESQGKLLEFTIEEGDQLTKNQQVGWVDTSTLHIQKEQLKAQKQAVASKLATITAQVEVQQEQKQNLFTEKNRIEKLYNDQAATKQKLDDINGKVNVLLKQLEATKTQISAVYKEMEVVERQMDLVDEKIKKAKIINPVNGTVLEKYVEESEIAGMGKALYKIARLDEIDLRVYISGAQLPSVKIGQEVTVWVDKDKEMNQAFDGKVIWISQQAEFTPKMIQTKEERVNMVYAVKIRVKNDGTMKIGMPGEVKFE